MSVSGIAFLAPRCCALIPFFVSKMWNAERAPAADLACKPPSVVEQMSMPSELASTRVVETIEPTQVYPPLPPGVSFQDIDSDSDDGLESNEDDYEAMLAAGEHSTVTKQSFRSLLTIV